MPAFALWLVVFVMALSAPTEKLRTRRLAILFLLTALGLMFRYLR